MPFLTIAFFGMDAGEMAMLIPILAISIPIVSIISKHRFRVIEMKMRMRGYNDQTLSIQQQQIEDLRNEVRGLRELLHQQMISVDSLLTNQAKLLESSRVREIQKRMSQ